MAVRQKLDRKQMAAYSTVQMEFIDFFDSDFQRFVGELKVRRMSFFLR